MIWLSDRESNLTLNCMQINDIIMIKVSHINIQVHNTTQKDDN
jgi:hypothetical protein